MIRNILPFLFLLFFGQSLKAQNLLNSATPTYPLTSTIDQPEQQLNFSNKANSFYIEDSSYTFKWDTGIVNWSPQVSQKKIIQAYDSLYHKVSERFLGRDSIGFYSSTIFAYSYDSIGRLTEILVFANDNFNWVVSERKIYSYNATNQVLSVVNQDWNQSVWVNTHKADFSYDANALLQQNVRFNWVQGAWNQVSRDTFTYTSSHKIASKVVQNYGAANWQNEYKYTYSYSAGPVLYQMITQEWNGSNWVYLLRDDYSYDPAGNLIQDLTRIFVSFTNWANYYRTTYSYDAANRLLTKDFKLWQNSSWLFFVSERKDYFPSGMLKYEARVSGSGLSNAVLEGDSTIYFYELVTSVNPLANEPLQLELSPNPAQELLYLNYKGNASDLQVKIFDLQGRLRKTLLLPHCHHLQLNLSEIGLSPGMYYCSLYSSNHFLSGEKLLVSGNH